ncbi:2486_t:CDS:1 [Cetraspora pellucida]|uniref:2486_t:CDS:1 n=1 Tax=Cetraspora pellucida TaxID=1433469 RepID=A0ACA9MMH8_9GLOM|nr:2486_t:CDS:1 [Cetraspora pellucida]
MTQLKTLFNIIKVTELDGKQFNILMYKTDDDSQYIISFVIEDKIYRCTLPDAKEVRLNEKRRDINPFPLFRMFIQCTFQFIADYRRKNRFKNPDISKLTGKMWKACEDFQKEFQKYTNEVNLSRPKPQFGFRPFVPNQTREERSNRSYRRGRNAISIVPSVISVQRVQQESGSSTELGEFYSNGLEWTNKNSKIDRKKQDDCVNPPITQTTPITENDPSVPTDDGTFNPLMSLPLGRDEVWQEEIDDYLNWLSMSNQGVDLFQFPNVNNFSTFNHDPSIQNNMNFDIPGSLNTNGFGTNGQDGQN